MKAKYLFWIFLGTAALASMSPHMTFVGFVWLIAFMYIMAFSSRFLWKMNTEDHSAGQSWWTTPARRERPKERPVAIPTGWSFEEYVNDGLRGIQIFLIQTARRDNA